MKTEISEAEVQPSSPPSEELIDDGTNKFNLICVHCPSKILTPKVGNFINELEFELPKMTQKRSAPLPETDLISEWFLIDDIYKFENVGVTYSVENIKYLSCSDCEYGPIGFHNIQQKNSYVALSRVKHQ